MTTTPPSGPSTMKTRLRLPSPTSRIFQAAGSLADPAPQLLDRAEAPGKFFDRQFLEAGHFTHQSPPDRLANGSRDPADGRPHPAITTPVRVKEFNRRSRRGMAVDPARASDASRGPSGARSVRAPSRATWAHGGVSKTMTACELPFRHRARRMRSRFLPCLPKDIGKAILRAGRDIRVALADFGAGTDALVARWPYASGE